VAKEAAELTFSAGGSAAPYTGSGLERRVRDIFAAAQHITLASPNYQMVGQAFLGADMRSTPLLFMDDRGGG
jgi:indole-3-acetate monooxygenase